MEYLRNSPAQAEHNCRAGFCFYFAFCLLWLRWVFVVALRLSLLAAMGTPLRGVREFLIAVASLGVERRLSSWDTRAQLPHSTWGLLREEIELLSAALATRPPGTSPALAVFKSSKQPEAEYCPWLKGWSMTEEDLNPGLCNSKLHAPSVTPKRG